MAAVFYSGDFGQICADEVQKFSNFVAMRKKEITAWSQTTITQHQTMDKMVWAQKAREGYMGGSLDIPILPWCYC